MNEVRKSHRSTANRVGSILEDAEYVSLVHKAYKRPLVPNKRCGLWYVDPNLKQFDAYFKSTDGHTGQWAFSLKRLNLHLLPLIDTHGGIILVDSTRRGKLMPDAFSKTVPIWCAVINSAIFGTDHAAFPPNAVSSSEQDQIRALIPGWASQFCRDVPRTLWPKLSKPLRPMWVTPSAPLPFEDFGAAQPIFRDAHAIILCTASKKAQDGQIWSSGYVYVQGAADDHELWAPQGFTPKMFWDHPEIREPGLGDAELLRRMRHAVDVGETRDNESPLVEVHSAIYITHSAGNLNAPILIDMRSHSMSSENSWPLMPGKRGAKSLGSVLPQICEYYEQNIHEPVIIASDAGTDFAECVALMIDCRYFDAEHRPKPVAKYVHKEEVVRRNLMIIAKSAVAPSRTSQNIIGSFLRKS